MLFKISKMLGNEPFKKGLPTDKSFIVKDVRNFEDEKKKLTDMADEWFNKSLETRKKNAEKKKAVPVGNN